MIPSGRKVHVALVVSGQVVDKDSCLQISFHCHIGSPEFESMQIEGIQPTILYLLLELSFLTRKFITCGFKAN